MHRLHRPWTTALALGLLAVSTAGCFGGDPQADAPASQQPRPTPQASAPASSPAAPGSSAAPSSPGTSAASSPAAPTSTAAGSAGGGSQGSGGDGPAVAPSSPVVSPSGSPPPRLVRYDGDGVTVETATDARRLHGTTADFRRFVVASVPQGNADCGSGSIAVQAWRADGFAVGNVFSCPGGYRAIWGTAGNGSWRQLIGAQDVWSCSELRRWSVPTSIAGDKCYAHGGLQDYRQA